MNPIKKINYAVAFGLLALCPLGYAQTNASTSNNSMSSDMSNNSTSNTSATSADGTAENHRSYPSDASGTAANTSPNDSSGTMDDTTHTGMTDSGKSGMDDSNKNGHWRSHMSEAWSYAGYTAPSTYDYSDRHFVEKFEQKNSELLAWSQEAAQKATNPEVKMLAEKIVRDHEKLMEKLPASAHMGEQHAEVRGTHKLDTKEGLEFDKAYLKAVVSVHDDLISELEKVARSSEQPELAQFAANLLPAFYHHYWYARQVERNLK